ncbi:hypothetical protein PINS_up001006 [Pythium insidiosum]|nr:hypothetical protein PINS_up001006 [Pythium insidiosum]
MLLGLERYVDTGGNVKKNMDTILSQLPKVLKTRIKTRLQLVPLIRSRIEFAKLVVREVGGTVN